MKREKKYHYLKDSEPIYPSDKFRMKKLRDALSDNTLPCEIEPEELYDKYLKTYVCREGDILKLYELWDNTCKEGLHHKIKDNKNIQEEEKEQLIDPSSGSLRGDIKAYIIERTERIGSFLGLDLRSFRIYDDVLWDGIFVLDMTLATFREGDEIVEFIDLCAIEKDTAVPITSKDKPSKTYRIESTSSKIVRKEK